MKKTNRKSGFTLVELMIVAAIIAILAAIIIPLLTKNRDKAVAADGQNLLGTTASAIKVQYAATGTAPAVGAITLTDGLADSEISKSKYFNKPTVTAISAGASAFTFTLSATIRTNIGSFATGEALTLTDAGAWGGAVATTAGL